MSEERRAESVDAAKAGAPTPPDVEEQLDDTELIEEVPAAKVPPVRTSQISRPPPDTSDPPAARQQRDSAAGARRARRGMALRIPDDEVSRPTPSVAPAAVAPSATVPAPPPAMRASTPAPASPSTVTAAADVAPVTLQPMRIISIEPEAAFREEPGTKESPAPAELRGAQHEDSWTPYQPTVADEAVDARSGTQPIADKKPTASSEELIPISSDTELEPVNGPESGEPLELDDAESHAVPSNPPPARTPPPPAPANRVPSVRPIPAAAKAVSAPPPPQRATAPTEPEGEEVKFDEDEPTPIAPPVERLSEPGDAAEISAEDMVSVESVPVPRAPAQPTSGQRSALAQPATPAVGFTPPPMRARAPSVPPVVPAPPAPPAPTPRPPLVIVPPHVGVAAPSTDASARRKARPWWEDLFNDDFIRTMAKITDAQIATEADFIEDSLGVAKGGTMLDLACGTGAHAIELAKRGYEVVGFDLSLAMLARAADDAQEKNQKLNFVQGDMREMTFDEAFDGVYCWNTSFGFFDEETNAKVVGRIHKSLKKGGQFMLDVANRDFIARQAPSLAWFEGDGCVCMDEMQIDWITSRMRVKRTLMMDDGRSKEIEYSVRLYALHELGKILHDQGFRVAEVSGRTGTPGVFFGAESPRTLILAEKR